MCDLSELFNKYGSDKTRNGYARLYHLLFNHMKNDHLKFLEIGIGTMIPGAPSFMVGYSLPGYKPGGSLRAWRDYFPNADIIGMDIQPDTQFTDDRIKTYLCDSTNKSAVKDTLDQLGNPEFDVIIEDGSHYFVNQMRSLSNFYPYLKNGGIYVIEDVGENCPFVQNPEMIEVLINRDPIVFCGRKSNLCVIHKNHLNATSTGY